MITTEEFNNTIKLIKEQECTLGVEIELYPIDKDHLNCLWYGGEVGQIKYNGNTFVIEARGEIRLSGKCKGIEDIDIVDKSNGGRVFSEFGRTFTDDDLITAIENGDLYVGDGNWFEINLIDKDNNFIDLCFADNILDDNILNCFLNVEDYFEYINCIN